MPKLAFRGDLTCDFENGGWADGMCAWVLGIDSTVQWETGFAPADENAPRKQWKYGNTFVKVEGAAETLTYHSTGNFKCGDVIQANFGFDYRLAGATVKPHPHVRISTQILARFRLDSNAHSASKYICFIQL